jgi:hypothetical protein
MDWCSHWTRGDDAEYPLDACSSSRLLMELKHSLEEEEQSINPILIMILILP